MSNSLFSKIHNTFCQSTSLSGFVYQLIHTRMLGLGDMTLSHSDDMKCESMELFY